MWYKDNGITIMNGIATKFDHSLCNVNSKFVTFIAKHYDESIAITFVDTLIRYIYTVNDKIGSSLNAKMLTPMP